MPHALLCDLRLVRYPLVPEAAPYVRAAADFDDAGLSSQKRGTGGSRAPDPEAYLREVLCRIGRHPVNRHSELLP